MFPSWIASKRLRRAGAWTLLAFTIKGLASTALIAWSIGRAGGWIA